VLGLGNLLILAGYTLVYAAVANGGAFASNPWNGLIASAYEAPSPGSSTGGGGTSLTGGLPSAIEHGNVGNIAKDLIIGSKNEPLSPAWIWANTGGRIFG